MAAVINRYQANTSERAGPNSSDIDDEEGEDREAPLESDVENEEITYLAERFLRLPTTDDPHLWAVRVHVSLIFFSLILTIDWRLVKDGKQEETFFLLLERIRPRLPSDPTRQPQIQSSPGQRQPFR